MLWVAPLVLSAFAAELKTCPLCMRQIPPELESRHHLVPKLKGGKTTPANIVVLHAACHQKIHAVFSEAELARDYDSIEALLTDERVVKFANWIAKRPPDFHDGTTSLRKRRQRRGRSRMLFAMEGLDAESDSVGPGIYGGGVQRDDRGQIVIGKQYEEHNALPGPVYDGGGYTELSQAIRTGTDAVRAVLDRSGSAVANEVTTGGATPLHVCGMSARGQESTQLLIEAGADVHAVDTLSLIHI